MSLSLKHHAYVFCVGLFSLLLFSALSITVFSIEAEARSKSRKVRFCEENPWHKKCVGPDGQSWYERQSQDADEVGESDRSLGIEGIVKMKSSDLEKLPDPDQNRNIDQFIKLKAAGDGMYKNGLDPTRKPNSNSRPSDWLQISEEEVSEARGH